MSLNKKIILSLIVLSLVVVIGYSLVRVQTRDNLSQQKDRQVLKIGVIASLTDKGAARGTSARQGLELARERIISQNLLPEYEIQLIIQDVPLNQPKKALSAFSKLTDVDRVVAIIGPMGSNVALSVTPLVDEKRIPMIIHTASTLNATQDNDYVFRLWPTALNYADSIADELHKRGYTNVAVITATRNNSIDLTETLTTKTGFELVIDERVGTDALDFKTSLLKIAHTDYDILFLNLFEGQIGLAARQARQLGLDKPVFVSNVMSPIELEVGPEYLEGAWFARFSGYTDTARDEFIARFGSEPSAPDSAAAAHDALLVLAEAIRAVGTDGELIKDYLYSKDEFEGVIGTFRFRESGDAGVPLSIKMVQNGVIK